MVQFIFNNFFKPADFNKPTSRITDMTGLATSVFSMIRECLKRAKDDDAAVFDDDEDDEPIEPFELRALRLLYKIDLVDPQLLYDGEAILNNHLPVLYNRLVVEDLLLLHLFYFEG